MKIFSEEDAFGELDTKENLLWADGIENFLPKLGDSWLFDLFVALHPYNIGKSY